MGFQGDPITPADPNYEQRIQQLINLIFMLEGLLDRAESDPLRYDDIRSEVMRYGELTDLFIITEETGTGDNIDFNSMINAISVLMNFRFDEFESFWLEDLNALRTTLLNNFNNLYGAMNSGFVNLGAQVALESTNIKTLIEDQILLLGGGIDSAISGLLGNIQQLFINNSSRMQQIIDTQNLNIRGQLAGLENNLTQQISAIQIPSDGGGTDITLDTGWDRGHVVDLLNLIDDIRMWLTELEFDPTVNVTVTGGGDGTDSSASIGDIIDGITFNAGDIARWLHGLNTDIVTDEFAGIGERFISLTELITRVLNNDVNTYQDFITEFNSIGGTGTATDLLIKATIAIPIFLKGIFGFTNPFINNLETLARTEALDNLLTRDEISELWVRELEDKNYLLDQFKRIGLSEDLAKKVVTTRTVQLPDVYVRDLYLKGLIDRDEHDDYLFKLGYQQQDLDKIVETYYRIPPVPDLIRFAVREAYDDNLADQLGLNIGYDLIKDRFENDLKQNGLNPDYGLLYWRSHWDLPSPTQGYEMLHRGEIDIGELERLLRVSDYSPEWIDKLINIAYSPFTRVDIRRMHKLGVLNYDEVVVAYKDIGYDQDKATKLADFTVQLNTESTEELDRDLTVSQILKAFVNDIISNDSKDTLLRNLGYNDAEINVLTRIYQLNLQAEQREDVTRDNRTRIVRGVSKSFIEAGISEQSARIYLGGAGYTSDEIDQEISTLRIERNLLLQSERIQTIQQSFIEFRITDNEARGELAREGYTPIEENDAIALWNTQRDNRFKEPTKAELKKWFIVGHITQDEYRNYLYALGYDRKLTDLYIQEAIDAREA